MSWTHADYMGASYGISIGLVMLTLFIMGITLLCSPDLVQVLVNSILDIDLESEGDPENVEVNIYDSPLTKTTPYHQCVRILLYIVTGFILSIMPVLIFEGCILTYTYVQLGDACPDDPADCFAFSDSQVPTSTFLCIPGNQTQINTNYSETHASCFGWVIRRQTTRKILDQVGICAGLIGLFGILLKLIVHIGRKKKIIAIAMIIITWMVAITLIILIVYNQWSLALLGIATLVLCGVVFTVGPVLAILVPKQTKDIRRTSVISAICTTSPVAPQMPVFRKAVNTTVTNKT